MKPEIEQLTLQYYRLKRHHHHALMWREHISFLDLTHCLRIWVDMKQQVDELAKAGGAQLTFKDTATPRQLKRILRSSGFIRLPLATGVESPVVQVKDVIIADREFTPDEISQLHGMGPPQAGRSNLSFVQWLGVEIFEENTRTGAGRERVGISRETLIKRVANVLGASHPMGFEPPDGKENRFDASVRRLHQIQLANGYPATYYQLLEIATDIIETFADWLEIKDPELQRSK